MQPTPPQLWLRNCIRSLLAICSLAISIIAVGAESEWVKTGVTGRLIYVPDADGDRILDFSNVGYRGRGRELIPQSVTNVLTLSPIAGDDTSQIQAAINQISTLPIGPDGIRGAVLLQPGTFDINSQLEIRASGVVLRGSGSGESGTVLHGSNPLTGGTNPNQRPLIEIYGSGNRSDIGSARNMIDKVVPAGARSFRVDSTAGFAVGDTVRIERPSTAAWIEAIGMDHPPDGDPPWEPGSMNLRYDRTITRIEGNRIFLDAPLANSFELAFGGGTIREYTWAGAIQNVGIENLRGDTDFDSPVDEDHAWEFISIGQSQNSNRAQNVWVRDVEVTHFGDSAVVANPGSKWVTVDNVSSSSPISQVTGERRYTFDLSGDLGLVTNSSADHGRHDFVNNSTRPSGPNVFHNSIAMNALNDSGPHQRWASGTLFDNITVEGDAINVRNRGSLGTSHGWTGSNMVIWNSQADSFTVQNPPTSQNWLVGSRGTIVADTEFGPQPSGNYDQSGPTAMPVTVGGSTSLYETQLSDAAEVTEFHDKGLAGRWIDAQTWAQSLAPHDSYHVTQRDYLIGDIDGFTYDGAGSVDNVIIDPSWQSAVTESSALPITKLDDLSGNENIAFTVQHTLDPGERVIHASLALALRQSAGEVSTDFIRLFDMDPGNKRSFASLGWDAELNGSETFVGVLDLGGDLAQLQTGSVNVQVNDDTGVDWALYTATIATPIKNTAAVSVFLGGGGTVLLDTAAAVGRLQLGGDSSSELQIGSSGKLDIAGDYSHLSNGVLGFELEPDGTGLVSAGGTANLAGSLDVTLMPELSPTAGDRFVLITASSVLGTFDQLHLPTLDSDFAWHLSYESTEVALQVVRSADFDADGFIGPADLAIWQAAFGINAQGDADGDGDSDGRDFLVWQRQYDGLVTGDVVAKSVPEPQSLTLLLTVAGMSCWSLKKRFCPTQRYRL